MYHIWIILVTQTPPTPVRRKHPVAEDADSEDPIQALRLSPVTNPTSSPTLKPRRWRQAGQLAYLTGQAFAALATILRQIIVSAPEDRQQVLSKYNILTPLLYLYWIDPYAMGPDPEGGSSNIDPVFSQLMITWALTSCAFDLASDFLAKIAEILATQTSDTCLGCLQRVNTSFTHLREHYLSARHRWTQQHRVFSPDLAKLDLSVFAKSLTTSSYKQRTHSVQTTLSVQRPGSANFERPPKVPIRFVNHVLKPISTMQLFLVDCGLGDELTLRISVEFSFTSQAEFTSLINHSFLTPSSPPVRIESATLTDCPLNFGFNYVTDIELKIKAPSVFESSLHFVDVSVYDSDNLGHRIFSVPIFLRLNITRRHIMHTFCSLFQRFKPIGANIGAMLRQAANTTPQNSSLEPQDPKFAIGHSFTYEAFESAMPAIINFIKEIYPKATNRQFHCETFIAELGSPLSFEWRRKLELLSNPKFFHSLDGTLDKIILRSMQTISPNNFLSRLILENAIDWHNQMEQLSAIPCLAVISNTYDRSQGTIKLVTTTREMSLHALSQGSRILCLHPQARVQPFAARVTALAALPSNMEDHSAALYVALTVQVPRHLKASETFNQQIVDELTFHQDIDSSVFSAIFSVLFTYLDPRPNKTAQQQCARHIRAAINRFLVPADYSFVQHMQNAVDLGYDSNLVLPELPKDYEIHRINTLQKYFPAADVYQILCMLFAHIRPSPTSAAAAPLLIYDGPPGVGKSTVSSGLVLEHHQTISGSNSPNGGKILLLAPTNVAIKNLLVASTDALFKIVTPPTLLLLKASYDPTFVEDLAGNIKVATAKDFHPKIIPKFSIIAATMSMFIKYLMNNTIFWTQQAKKSGELFSMVIVDEASNLSFVQGMLAMSVAPRSLCFFVGDSAQLPPVNTGKLGDLAGFSQGFLSALASTQPQAVFSLIHNYRSLPELLIASNRHSYPTRPMITLDHVEI